MHTSRIRLSDKALSVPPNSRMMRDICERIRLVNGPGSVLRIGIVGSPALVEIDHLQAMSYRQALRWAGDSESRLRLVAKANKRGWVLHRLRDLQDDAGDQLP
jgi:hypothetical protein